MWSIQARLVLKVLNAWQLDIGDIGIIETVLNIEIMRKNTNDRRVPSSFK